MDDVDIGGFLRSRREAITPAEVGLPTGLRRRTPGLRRSELAMLAGISVEYLTRIEQGRDRHPSSQVLGALADALRLSTEDRLLLMRIVKSAGGTGICPGPIPPGQAVRGTVRTLLERMDPSPAFVQNRLGDVLAYTDGFRALFEPAGFSTTSTSTSRCTCSCTRGRVRRSPTGSWSRTTSPRRCGSRSGARTST